MQLTMREQEKMMISLAAMIAQRRKDKGIKLNHPEAVALITDYVLEGAREGKTVVEYYQRINKPKIIGWSSGYDFTAQWPEKEAWELSPPPI